MKGMKPAKSYGKNANVKESRLNKGGDLKYRGARSGKGKSKGKGKIYL